MSERLQKLVEYLNNGNYEMAIAAFHDSLQHLSEPQIIELARAFYVNQNYKKSSNLLDQLTKTTSPQVKYQSYLLKAKTCYMMGQKNQCIKIMNNLQQEINMNSKFYSDCHRERVAEILACFEREQKFNKVMAMSKNDVYKFGKSFMDQLTVTESGYLMLGMPMFLVSEIWFNKMKAFCGLGRQDGQYPGFITHFEIVDDRYQMLKDPAPQKSYTNYLLFPNSSIKVLHKQNWIRLRQIFEGYDVKRFNISALGKPNEILTELHLKKIKVMKQNNPDTYFLQISKKQSWGSVMKKLAGIWKFQGILYENKVKKKYVEEKQILEDIDTVGSVYIYTHVYPEKAIKVAAISYRCNNCKKTENLKFCQCKTVKYCDIDCLREDRKNHKKRCQLEISHIKQKVAIAENYELSQKQFSGRKGIVGLRNLGNTCYMNSGLQCLSNTRELTQYFMSNKFLKHVNNTNPLGTKGNLSCAYAELIRQMWAGKQSYVSPFKLKKIIGKFSPQFSGFGQQDSQQLISYLIDGLQEDLNLVKNKQTFEVKDQILPDEEASLISQMNYAKRIKAYVRDLMAGQFKSTVICSICHRKSICFDPYMLVSLPIPSLKEKAVFFIAFDPNEKTMKINVEYDNDTLIGDLKQVLAKLYRVDLARGSKLECFIINLESKQIQESNIKNQQKYIDIISKLKQDEQIFFYEFSPLRKNQKMFQVDVYFQNKKINIPKFSNINPSIPQKQLVEDMIPIFSRFYQGKYPKEVYQSPPEISDKGIKIHLKIQLQMLKCKTQSQKIVMKNRKINLQFCLKNFSMTQVLQKNNQWYCNKCKKFVKATKQMEIYKTSKILVLAFKRFSRGWKVKNPIEFPVDGLNMAPFIISQKGSKPINYDLYGIVNHYGSLHGGHYTAYCKNFLNDRWFQFDDSRVSQIRMRDVVSESAYVLFYRRRQN